MASTSTTLIFGAVLFGCGFSVISTSALAETTATAPSSVDVTCLQTPAKISDSDLQSFMANPGAILSQNPTGGLPLTSRVRELAGSSSHAFEKIMGLLGTANDGQKSAIAAGLARAVYVCNNTGTEASLNYATTIQTAVASGDPTFASTFQQSSKDVNVAAVGPGAGGDAVIHC